MSKSKKNTGKRNKRLQKKKNKRLQKQKEVRNANAPLTLRQALNLAQNAPYGPAYILSTVLQPDDSPTAIAVAVVTRRLPRGLFVAQSLILDRSCLGIKQAQLHGPITEYELDQILQHLPAMSPIDPLECVTLVYHTLDYARSIGFAPHKDLSLKLLGPRPTPLPPSPYFQRLEKPHYIAGPHDNINAILHRLNENLGRGNYHYTLPLSPNGPSYEQLDSVASSDDYDYDDEDYYYYYYDDDVFPEDEMSGTTSVDDALARLEAYEDRLWKEYSRLIGSEMGKRFQQLIDQLPEEDARNLRTQLLKLLRFRENGSLDINDEFFQSVRETLDRFEAKLGEG